MTSVALTGSESDMTYAATESRAVGWGRYAPIGLATVVVAVLANVIVYYLAGLVVRYDPIFPPLATSGGAIIFTVVPAIVAVLLYAALLRFAANPPRVLTAIAAVVLVLSVIPDFTYIPTVPGASAGQTAVLVVMHVVAAVAMVGMLTRLAPKLAR